MRPIDRLKVAAGRCVSVVSFLVVVYVFGALGFWTADRKPPVEVLASEVVNKEVAPGEDLLVKRTVFRERQCATEVDRVFIDSQGFRFVLADQTFAVFGPLGTDSFTTVTPVPTQMAPGPARYYTAVQYRCNPVQEVWPVRAASKPVEFVVK